MSTLRPLRSTALALALLAACAVGDGPHGTGLQYYLSADPVSLDPALSNDVQSGEVVTLLFDNLVQFDADARLQPDLATRWESDSTGRVYTFHLRTGPTFHDGRTIRAALQPAGTLATIARAGLILAFAMSTT